MLNESDLRVGLTTGWSLKTETIVLPLLHQTSVPLAIGLIFPPDIFLAANSIAPVPCLVFLQALSLFTPLHGPITAAFTSWACVRVTLSEDQAIETVFSTASLIIRLRQLAVTGVGLVVTGFGVHIHV